MLASETDTARLGRRQPRLDALADKIALELSESSHDRAHQLAA
jgi:hypothetical protein